MNNDKPASESVAALSKEDGKRIDQYLNETLPGYSMRSEREWVKRGIEYEHRHMATKQAELVEERDKFREALEEIASMTAISMLPEHLTALVINMKSAATAALTKTPKP